MTTSSIIRVIGFDMGTSNLACCVVTAKLGLRKYKILEAKAQMVTPTIKDLTKDFAKQHVLFRKRIHKIVSPVTKKSKTMIAAERFMARGLRGKTIECVSVMIGVIATKGRTLGAKTTLLSAATWKNHVHRRFGKGLLETLYKTNRKQAHMLDAFFIALYVLDKFELFRNKRQLLNAVKSIQFLS